MVTLHWQNKESNKSHVYYQRYVYIKIIKKKSICLDSE